MKSLQTIRNAAWFALLVLMFAILLTAGIFFIRPLLQAGNTIYE